MEIAGAAESGPVQRTAGVAVPGDGEKWSPNGKIPAPLSGEEPAVVDIDFRAMIERIPAITYVAGFGGSGRWHYVSAQIQSMLGFSPDEWQADPDLWFKQIHPEDRGRALSEEAESKSSGAPLRSEYRMLTRSGDVIWVRDEGVLVRDEGGRPLFWQGFMINITRRRLTEQALHESEVEYRSLFDHVPVGLYRTTPDGTLQDGNRALAQILGYPNREALLAQDATAVYLDPSDRERWKEELEAAGTISDFEMQHKRRDGGVIWVHDSARVVRDHDDQVLHYEGVLVDITQRKQAEWEARQAHQQLSSKVHELERRNREMSLINEMGNMLQSCPTAEEAYAVMAHWAEQLFDGRTGVLCVIAPSRNIVEPVAQWGGSGMAEHAFAPEDCWALRSGRLHVVEDPKSRLVCPHLSEPVSGPYLCVPMMAQGEALGVLHLQAVVTGMSDGLDSADTLKPLVVAVADHLALALANLKLRETLRSQSIRDPLTGLFNRRYMEESLERELRRAERRSQPLGVIMLDLDHFSRFNNTFGHQAGDLLLQAFGETVRARVRVEDIACRFGGEEFTLILPEATLGITLDRAQKIVEVVRELHVSHRGQSLGTVTISAGVAAYPEHARTGEGLIRAADTALYIAKGAGRDRVAVASAEEFFSTPDEGLKDRTAS
jgi:diguanylate cyclase (GGDEF)-like protein/PAS domain S-box-containing protein